MLRSSDFGGDDNRQTDQLLDPWAWAWDSNMCSMHSVCSLMPRPLPIQDKDLTYTDCIYVRLFPESE